MGRRLGDFVELELSPQPQMFFLVRMIAASIASFVRFEPGQVEDLRLAVDELLLTLTPEAHGYKRAENTLRVEFQWHVDLIEVSATLLCGTTVRDGVGSRETPGPDDGVARTEEDPDARTRLAISRSILEAVVDEYGTSSAGEAPRAWLRVARRAVQD